MLEDTGRLPSADLGGADENANPLADDASADRARGNLAVQFSTSRRRGADIDIDANTVPSVLQPEQRRIADLLEADGAPSWVLRVLQGICAAASIGIAAYVWSLAAVLGFAQAEPNALVILSCWFAAAPAYMMLSIPLSAVRD